MDASAGPFAPGRLELVRGFVNTLDIDAGTDAMADGDGWGAWAASRGIGGVAGVEDLARLRTLREALRAGLLANHDRVPLPEGTQRALNAALEWSGVASRFTARGLELAEAGEGPQRLAGAVVAAVADALADGTWSRLKACRDDTCRWAFYDQSRSRTGQWCSMEVCGNRNKQARWRRRQANPPE